MENTEILKATGIEKFPGRFIKGGTEILTKSIYKLCNLTISHGIFPNACKLQNSNLFLRSEKN